MILESFEIGKTNLGLSIQAFYVGPQIAQKSILIMGGVHGDEVEGVVATQAIISKYIPKIKELGVACYIIPCLNLDGFLARQRANFNNVDLNRNLNTRNWDPVAANPRYQPGPKALSEPENQALVKFIQEKQIKFIYSLHSWKPMLNINGDSRKVAEAIQKHTSYIIEEDIGYPTPGALGAWGTENQIPVLTYEIERGLDFQSIIKMHVPAIIESLSVLK